MISNDAINFVKGNYGDLGDNNNRRNKLQDEEKIKIELREKLKNGEITHEEYLKEYDEKIQGRFKSLNEIDDFKLDKDINIGSVYFVTREKQDPEYPDDKYLCYELYDKNTGKLIADTDKDNNLNFYDEKLLKKYPQLQEQAKKMFPMAKAVEKEDINGEKKIVTEDNVIVKNALDYEQENKINLEKDIEEDREHTVYNKVDKDRELNNEEPKEQEKEAEDEKTLLEKANKKNMKKENNNDGKGKVVVAKLIEDPAVRENIPDATVKTWMVMYENGEMDMLNGRGEKLQSITNSNQRSKNMDSVKKEGDDQTRVETTFVVKGRENGLVFPVTKEANRLQLNIQDRQDSKEIMIPVIMQGNIEKRDNRELINASKIIDEILAKEEYAGLLRNDPEISNRILEMCYAQNDTSLSFIQQNIDMCNMEYEKDNNIEPHKDEDDRDIPEDREIETPEEAAWRRMRESKNN